MDAGLDIGVLEWSGRTGLVDDGGGCRCIGVLEWSGRTGLVDDGGWMQDWTGGWWWWMQVDWWMVVVDAGV